MMRDLTSFLCLTREQARRRARIASAFWGQPMFVYDGGTELGWLFSATRPPQPAEMIEIREVTP